MVIYILLLPYIDLVKVGSGSFTWALWVRQKAHRMLGQKSTVSTITSACYLSSGRVWRFIGLPLRLGVGNSAHRFPHPFSLTPCLRSAVANGLPGGPIPVSGSDGLTRSCPTPVTRVVAVSGLGSDVTPSHFATTATDDAEAASAFHGCVTWLNTGSAMISPSALFWALQSRSTTVARAITLQRARYRNSHAWF